MRDYAILRMDLVHDLGESDPYPLSDMNHSAAASSMLLSSFYKKLCPSGHNASADAAALEKFLSINSSSAQWHVPPMSELHSRVYDAFRDHIRCALDSRDDIRSYDLSYLADSIDCGPGAAQLSNPSSLLTKLFGGTLSYYHPQSLALYRAAIASSGFWSSAEKLRSDRFGETMVRGGKIFFVKKTTEISRTCCTESNVDMLLQKGIGNFIESRLEWYFGINLSSQPDKNRELARQGSLNDTLCTIDLASASDSISRNLLRAVLPDTTLKGHIFLTAGDNVILPGNRVIEKGMISTMGNGFTFPLETLLFACAVRSVYDVLGYPWDRSKSDWGVFGDDIIVRSDAYHLVTSFLTLIGFSVNDSKSFFTGPFRESCGHDYFRGRNVRGVYITTLETPQSLCSAFNRLVRWSCFHGVPIFRTLARLRLWLGANAPMIPYAESDDAGIKVPFEATRPIVNAQYWFRYRYFKRLNRKATYPEPDECGFGSDAMATFILSGRTHRPPTAPNLPKHSFVAVLRDREDAPKRYKVSSASVPYWDYCPFGPSLYVSGEPKSVELTPDRYDDWKAVVLAIV